MLYGILCSGGLDSIVLSHFIKKIKGDNFKYLFYGDYGHTASVNELKSVNYFANKLNLEVVILDLKQAYKKEGTLFEKNHKPKYNMRRDDVRLDSASNIAVKEFCPLPARSLLFFTNAYIKCCELGVEMLYTGFQQNDNEWFDSAFDCKHLDMTKAFIDDFNKKIKEWENNYNFYVSNPFIELGFNKTDIIKLGIDLGVDFDKTYSCWFGGNCGKCVNCIEIKNIFKILKKEG